MSISLGSVLWQHRNRHQIRLAGLGLFLGFFLVLLAFQTLIDVRLLLGGAGDRDILVLNRKLGLGMKEGFEAEDLLRFREQGFFQDVGSFESNRFRATARSERLGFQTELFLQAVPNRFLDVDTSDFVYQRGKALPLLLSSDYLALYNFGFAPSQGLPQFTAESIGLVDFNLVVYGREGREMIPAKIMGFTKNVNSILVPWDWLQEANERWGRDEAAKPSKQLIVRTDNPYHKGLEQFLVSEDCEISRGGLIGGGLRAVLYLLIALMIGVGGIILALSLLVFLLNYQLLIAQASGEIQLLLQLGYRVSDLIGILWLELRRTLLWCFACGLGAVFPLKFFLGRALVEQGYSQVGVWPSLWLGCLALALAAGFAWINYRSIGQRVRELA